MSVREVFRQFFANNAPYSFDYALQYHNYEFDLQTDWAKPEVEEFQGYKVIA